MRSFVTTAAALAGAAACGLALLASAAAQSLTAKDVEGFIHVMERSEALGEAYPDTADRLDAQMPADPTSFASMIDDQGRLTIFSTMIGAMDQVEGEPGVDAYRDLVDEAGFDGLPAFGQAADAVMMAYLATKIAAEGDPMADFDPAMLDMMPPAMREQMAPILEMMEAVERVPAVDIEVLTPYKAQLDAAMDG